MPQAPVPPDSTASSVDAVAAALETLRGGGIDSRPTVTTGCPPRLRRVVALMSAKRAIARVEDALTGQDARAEVADALAAGDTNCGRSAVATTLYGKPLSMSG
jgi:hypothetical protein